MSAKRLMLISVMVVLIAMLATQAFAQDDEELSVEEWQWAEAGLTFEYPGDWQVSLNEESFEFVLFEVVEGGANFVGLQMGAAGPESDLNTIFTQLGESFSAEVEEIEFGGAPALRLEFADETGGQQGIYLGFQPDEGRLALLTFIGMSADWENFSAQADEIIASAEVNIVELDVATLSAQLQASLENDGVLRLGDADAPVTMVEGLDFSCPHCINYGGNVERIINDFVNTGDVQLEFVFVTFVGGEASETAAHAQYCAASQGFGWEMHKILFDGFRANQSGFYNVGTITAAVAASGLDVDVDALESCINDGTFDEQLENDAQRAEELGIQSTPSLLFSEDSETAPDFIRRPDGEPLRGGVSLFVIYDYMRAALES